jgi:hypothetical protein
MQARLRTANPVHFNNVSVKVVIAYDNLQTAKRAEAIYERLAERLGESFDFEQHLWRFDVLEEERFRAEAAQDAAAADILIVATMNDAQLPAAVQSWLEASLQQHRGVSALVALLQHQSAPVQPYLEDVARRGGMDFFAQSEEAHETEGTPLPLRVLPADENPRWLTNN